MLRAQKSRGPAGSGGTNAAAWGKHLTVVLLLATHLAFGQRWDNLNAKQTGRFAKIAPDLEGMLAQAKHGSINGQTVKVIVQYKQVPTASHYATMNGRGARL